MSARHFFSCGSLRPPHTTPILPPQPTLTDPFLQRGNARLVQRESTTSKFFNETVGADVRALQVMGPGSGKHIIG